MSNPSHQQEIVESVREWQSRLLQLDRRNALLYFPIGKRGVTLQGISSDALLGRLATSRTGLAFLYVERVRATRNLFDGAADIDEQEPQIRVRPGDLDTDLPPLELQKRLASLSKRTREWQEEQGLNVLFLALGFLHWVDEDDELACSPLLLVPCDLTRASPRDPFLLLGDESEDLIVNPTLRYKLASATGIELPEIGEETAAGYLATTASLVAGREGWRVEPSIVLATFPFSKLAMWEDLNLMVSAGVAHPLVRRLAGDTGAQISSQPGGQPAIPMEDAKLQGALLDDLLGICDQYAVVDADFSQLRAIELARSGTNLVIHGPPGTGKSQTIANIIATLVAEGRRVLFVSEKTAALDVVKRRLAEVGLGGFCLDLHSDRGKKDSVYAQLQEALNQSPADPQDFPYERLLKGRQELNAIVRALHEIRQPLGVSVFSIHGRVAAINEVPRLNVAVRDVDLLDDDRLRRIEEAARRIARREAEFHDHHTSRWRSLGPVSTSPLLTHEVRDDITLIRSAIDTVLDAISIASEVCGVAASETLVGTGHLLRLLAHLKATPDAIPPQWLDPGGLQRALASTEALRQGVAERRKLVSVLLSSISRTPAGLPFKAWLAAALGDVAESARWERMAGPSWSVNLLAAPQTGVTEWRAIELALRSLQEASVHLQMLLVIEPCLDSRAAAQSAAAVAGRLLKIGKVPAAWSTAEALGAIRIEVANARRVCDELVSVNNALAETFAPEIVERVDEEMLVRYRTDHRSYWRRLGSTFRRDHRMIRGCLRHVGKLSVEEATTAIEQALSVRRLQKLWSHTGPSVAGLLGDRFAGLNTDWASIEAALDDFRALDREFADQETTFHSILAHEQLLAHVENALREVIDRTAVLDALWPTGTSRWDDHIPDLTSDAHRLAELSGRIAAMTDALLPFVQRPTDLNGLVDLLKVGARLEELEAGAADASVSRAGDLGAFFSGWSTDFERLDLVLDWMRELEALVEPPLPTALKNRVIQPLPSPAYAKEELALSEAMGRLREAYATVSPRFPEAQTPWGSWESAPLETVRAWCEDLYAHAQEANDWVEYRTAATALDDAVGAQVMNALRAVIDDSTLVPDTVLSHVYLAWLGHVYRAVPVLQFAPRDMEEAIKKFRDLDARLPRSTRERVRAACLAVYPSNAGNPNGMGELGVLGRELSKRKRRLPVRKLVARVPNLLQKLKPVFMMSPLAVSQYLPRGVNDSDTLTFDTVIFDEASQVFPEDAVPTIARGRQCIVVGDQLQLPPTSFFRKGDSDDFDADDDVPTTENRLVGVESILDVLVGMSGAGVSAVYLQVHYRSQHDALIRYSNHYFYSDRLLTFPSALRKRPGLGIRSIYLPDARFEAGGSRTNRVEAERVVQTVFELMEVQPPTESIGVVALSRPQADLIQELIDLRRISDRRFDARFAEQAHERFFVKNLENVQGDERDHMILSIGYGPTTGSGAVPNRFGPLNAEGGHRRLNVAVSRARRSMTVVHSLRPEDIHSEMPGAQLLRRYLEFLRNGDASIEGAVTLASEGEAESAFEEAVGRALEQRGYLIKRQVGCAKYSIDIAVVSRDGSSFDLGIECDGAAYHRSPSARDRDRLRQEILERLGWRGRIHRVWSTAWIRNPEAEIAAIERSIRRARSKPHDEPVAPGIEAPPSVQGGIDQKRRAARNPSSAPILAAEAPQLAVYVKADLRRFSKTNDLREERPRVIAQLVAAVVETEGPVHLELIIERIREHYGLGRAGRIVREAVIAGAREAIRLGAIALLPSVRSTGEQDPFLVTKLGSAVKPRGQMKDGTVRKIDHVCDQEIDAAVVDVVAAMVGAKKEEAVIAAARAFGYARTGSQVEERMGAAVDRLLETGTLKDRLGSLVLAD